MKKFNLLIKLFVVYFFYTSLAFSSNLNFFDEGKLLFENKKFDKSKIFFEKDIVFNPKSENGYMYLAKIYLQESNDEEQETNLNNVLLINPQNDEAIYMLTLLKIKYSDYDKAKELIENFDLICKSFCSKKAMPSQSHIGASTISIFLWVHILLVSSKAHADQFHIFGGTLFFSAKEVLTFSFKRIL